MSDAQVSVVCCYANTDASYFRALQAHLSGLEQQGLITVWHEGKIPLGSDRAQAIHAHLETAALILFLVSSDLSACCKTEMQQAMERHKVGQALVVPVLVRPCNWQLLPLGSLQYLPRDGQPITEWSNEDRAWHDVVAEIRRTVEDLSLLSVGRPHSALPPVWNIPYARNAFFLGRDGLLLRLHTELQRGEVAALSQPQAISGLGGIVQNACGDRICLSVS